MKQNHIVTKWEVAFLLLILSPILVFSSFASGDHSKKSAKAQSWNGLRANSDNTSYVHSEITSDAVRERGLRVLWKHDQRTVVQAHPSVGWFPGLFQSQCEDVDDASTLSCVRKLASDVPPAVHKGSGSDPDVVYLTTYKWGDPLLRNYKPFIPSSAVTPFGTVGRNVGHGLLTAMSADTGTVLWQHRLSDYSDTSGCVRFGGSNADNCRELEFSRSTPVIAGDLIYLGTYTASVASQSADMYEGFLQRKSHLSAEELGTGAFMLAINRHSGELVWAKRLSNSVNSSTINATVVAGGTVYVGVVNLAYSSNWFDTLEEFAVPIPIFDQRFEHRETRGALLALDMRNGDIRWKVYHAPPRPAELPHDQPWYSGASSGYGGAISFRTGNSTESGKSGKSSKNTLELFIGTSNNSTVPVADMLCEKDRRAPLGADERDELDQSLLERSNRFGRSVSCNTKKGHVQLNDAFNKHVSVETDGAGKTYQAYSFGNMADSIYSLRINSKPGTAPKLQWVFRASQYDRFNELCSLLRPALLQGVADNLRNASPYPLGDDEIFRNVDQAGLVQECTGRDSLNGTDAIALNGVPMGVANTDFAVGPVITKDPKGTPVIVALNKDGFVYFLNPANGKLKSKVRQGPFTFSAAYGFAVGKDKIYSNVTFANNRLTGLPYPFGNDFTPRRSLSLCKEFNVRFNSSNNIADCSVPVENILSGTVVNETVGAMVNAMSIATKSPTWMSPDPSGNLNLPGVERDPYFFDGLNIDSDFDITEEQELSFAGPLPGRADRLYIRSNYGGHLTATEDVVFVGSASSDVRLGMHALDATTGEIIWVFPRSLFELNGELLPSLVASAPAIVGNRLYWGSGHHGLFTPPIGQEAGPGAAPVSGEGSIFFAFELCPEGTKVATDFESCEPVP